MVLLLLTARPALRTNQRFVEAASGLGVDLRVFDASGATAVLADDRVQLLDRARAAVSADVIIPRIGNWRPESLLAVLEAAIGGGAASPNPSNAIRIGRDHWATVRTLAAAGLPVVPTVAGSDPETLAATVDDIFSYPVVVKQRRSRMGVGVVRCETLAHLEGVLDSLWRVGDEVVVQPWIPGGQTSYRLLVAGGSVVAAATFSACDGEFRSNSARGGNAASYDPKPAEIDLAVAAAAELGLGQCGIDIVIDGSIPRVLEINPTPGFLRLEEATGVDVARALVEHALTCAI
jgi:RimK family alpha-L-glutamate ligase